MKKIYFALIALTLGVSAQAQRNLSFQVSVDTPTLNQNIITGSTIYPVYLIKNVSATDADSLGAGETFWFVSPQSGAASGTLGQYGVTLGRALKKGETFRLNNSAFLPDGYKIPFDSIKSLLSTVGDSVKLKPFTANKQYKWYLQIANISYLTSNPKVDDVKSTLFTQLVWINRTTGLLEFDLQQSAIKTYPNPAVNQLSFEYNFASNEKATATILDATGRTIMVKDLGSNSGAQKFDLDITAVQSGMYILRLNVGDQSATTKFNVQK